MYVRMPTHMHTRTQMDEIQYACVDFHIQTCLHVAKAEASLKS